MCHFQIFLRSSPDPWVSESASLYSWVIFYVRSYSHQVVPPFGPGLRTESWSVQGAANDDAIYRHSIAIQLGESELRYKVAGPPSSVLGQDIDQWTMGINDWKWARFFYVWKMLRRWPSANFHCWTRKKAEISVMMTILGDQHSTIARLYCVILSYCAFIWCLGLYLILFLVQCTCLLDKKNGNLI